VVVEDNLTVVYGNFPNKTRFGCFRAPLVVFGQQANWAIGVKLLERLHLSNG
jgi:hypothetical protein